MLWADIGVNDLIRMEVPDNVDEPLRNLSAVGVGHFLFGEQLAQRVRTVLEHGGVVTEGVLERVEELGDVLATQPPPRLGLGGVPCVVGGYLEADGPVGLAVRAHHDGVPATWHQKERRSGGERLRAVWRGERTAPSPRWTPPSTCHVARGMSRGGGEGGASYGLGVGRTAP